MDKDGDSKNGVRVEMDKFNLIVIKESTEKVTGQKAASALEESGKHHNLVCIGCRNISAGSWMPLQHGAVRKKVVREELMK
jgi:hypothetical protein